VRKFVAGLNAMGITAWYDAGGRGVNEKHYEAYKALADRGELNARRRSGPPSASPRRRSKWTKVLREIQQHTPFPRARLFREHRLGRIGLYARDTNLLRNDFVVRSEDMREVRRIAHAVAEGGMFLNAHVEMENAIDAYLDEYEAVNKVEPIKGLRWRSRTSTR